MKKIFTFIALCIHFVSIAQDTDHSIARKWNDVLLELIRNDFARPTVHARNLFHHSIAMYDAWAAYDTQANPYLLGNIHHGFYTPFRKTEAVGNISSAREEAISYASYRLLNHRFKNSPAAENMLQKTDSLMLALNYSPAFSSTAYQTDGPAALGNYIAQKIIEYGLQDGSNEQLDYANAYYESVNEPLITHQAGIAPNINPNRWQPLKFETFIDQSGNEIKGGQPSFLGAEWGNVLPFALSELQKETHIRDGHAYNIYLNPGPPVYLDTNNHTAASSFYKWNFELVALWSSLLEPKDTFRLDISPASLGNIPLEQLPSSAEGYKNFYNKIDGGDVGTGYTMNPVTKAPYQKQIVKRGDYARVLAEFWADGPDSETPPGHWFTILNYVNDNPLLTRKFGGKGVVLDKMEWDVKGYFVLGGAMHDAAIAAWSVKGYYDYVRPISAIRYLSDKGQCTDSSLSNYHPAGINLIPGRIEVVAEGDPLQGFRKEHIGKIKIKAWRGHSVIADPERDNAGVDWVLAEQWTPYQRQTFVTPPFAGYVSGHSTFSRAAAEVLTQLTGDSFFPGGLGVFGAKKNEFLVFENGPFQDMELQWATYMDASDQCSLSRIWGGIHPPIDDIPGRLMGHKIGPQSFEYALQYFEGKNGITGVSIVKEESFAIYPNPVFDILTVDHITGKENINLKIYDLKGVLFKEVHLHSRSRKMGINVSELPAGLYIIAIGMGNAYKKFIKH